MKRRIQGSTTTTLDALPAAATLSLDDGAALTGERRAELLAAVRAGNGPARLEVTAKVFRQGATPNRNFTRIAPARLAAFAESFDGVPLLRDHDRALGARAGTVLDVELAAGDEPAIVVTAELVTPWAIEGALSGTIDRFSVGWISAKGPTCSACDNPVFSLDCEHFPGDEVDGRFVEAVYHDAQGVEISAVTVPAVEGTGVQAVRAALAATRADLAKPQRDVVLELAAEREAHDFTRRALADTAGELARERQAAMSSEVDRMIEEAFRAGKIIPGRDAAGNLVRSPTETAIREMARVNLAAARSYVASMPALVPVRHRAGRRMQSDASGHALHAFESPGWFAEQRRLAASRGLPLADLDAVQAEVNRALGIDDKTFDRFAPGAADGAATHDNEEER